MSKASLIPQEGWYYAPCEDKVILYYRGLQMFRTKNSMGLKVAHLYECWVNYYPTPLVDKFVLPEYKLAKIKSGEWVFLGEDTHDKEQL